MIENSILYTWIQLQLMIFIFSLFSCIFFVLLAQVPLENIYYPVEYVRSGRNSLVTTNTINYASDFTIVFPTDLNLVEIPHFFIGVYDYKWSEDMSLNISITEVGVLSGDVRVELVTKVFFFTTSYIVLDSKYMSITSEMFILDSPKTETVFTITNHKNYQIVLLTEFAYQELTSISTPTPIIRLDIYISRQSMSISVEISVELLITQLTLTMFRINTALMPIHYNRFGAIITIATNTNNTLWDNIVNFQQDNDGYYFVGLQILYSIQNNPLHSFLITTRATSNVLGYLSQLMNLIRFCPVDSPYFNLTDLTCIADCGDYYYPSLTQVCTSCDPLCKRCFLIPENCTQCEASLTLTPVESSNQYPNNTCGCPPQQFVQFTPTPTCSKCQNYCKSCTVSSCSECYPSFYYNLQTRQCECRGKIITLQGTSYCISKTVKQYCKIGQITSQKHQYSCDCPDTQTLIKGQCI